MISERESLVLSAIVNYYLTTGETVGSRTLVKKYGIELSSATIRNVMADLEDLGMLTKTHTSSGRIPTDKGYRYYLNELLEIEKLTKAEKENIENVYEKRVGELDNILQQTSALLSKVTTYAGLVIEPNHQRDKIKKIELVHIDDDMLMAVIVMDNRAIRTKKIFLEEKITREEVFHLTNELNEKISSGEFSHQDIQNMLNTATQEGDHSVGKMIENELMQDFEGRLFINNAPSIINSSDETTLEAFKILDNNKHIKLLFEEMVHTQEKNYGEVNVIFGDELNIKGLENFSFVYSIYKVGDSEGVVGVIGPKRMAYSKTIGLVDYVAKEVNKVINKMQHNREDDE